MYKRFETTDRIFVNRERYLDWMDTALTRCRERPALLHIQGIGGIGKSSLLEYWQRTIPTNVLLNCEQHTSLYARLNFLARGVSRLGIKTERFDLLSQIRLRFVEGVEPAQEPGRDWAKDVLAAIPFIGSLSAIGSAITAVGKKVVPKLKGKYGDFGIWLQNRLGKDYIEELLEILWKDPHHAEILFLDALVEDINNRKEIDDPILFLFDHYERVDNTKARWRFEGRKITEIEIWYKFLGLLKNSIGVVGSRRHIPDSINIGSHLEEVELTELDIHSSHELLSKRGIGDSALRDKVVSVSGGNPFIIDAICDTVEMGDMSIVEVESLRAETLEEVRLKTWRCLFSEVEGLLDIVYRVGLLPFFNRQILDIIIPSMSLDKWERLSRLSFVRDRGDGTWVLHDLAKELVKTELGLRLDALALEISEKLEEVALRDSDYTIHGIALSVLALANEKDAADKIASISLSLGYQQNFLDELTFLNAIRIDTDESLLLLLAERGRALLYLMRWAECEHNCSSAIEMYDEILDSSPVEFRLNNEYNLGVAYLGLGALYWNTNRPIEAETAFRKGIKHYREFAKKSEIACEMHHVGFLFLYLGNLLFRALRFEEAEELFLEALLFFNELEKRGRFSEFRTLMSAIDISKRGQAFSLMCLAALNKQRGKYSDAEESQYGALARFSDLFETSPTANPRFKVMSLNNLGVLLRHSGKLSEAEEHLREALEIVRSNVKERPDDASINDQLASILNNIGLIHLEKTTLLEAVEYIKKALEIRRMLYERIPERYGPRLTSVLNNYGIVLSESEKHSEAEDLFNEALQICRELVIVSVDFHLPKLASTLNNLGLLFKRKNRISHAETIIQEAYAIARKLYQKSPLYFVHFFARILGNYKIVLTETGKTVEEVEIAIEDLRKYDVTLSLEWVLWSEEDEEESTPF
ncbi:MAG: tetratricopeptide repeat protein [Candidatus Thorarchaeota archaeon]